MIASTAEILNLGSCVLKALARDGEACEILKLYTDFYGYVSGGISFFFLRWREPVFYSQRNFQL